MKRYLALISLSWLLSISNSVYLDSKGNYRGSSSDSGSSVDFYDRSNQPAGWYDKGTNTLFDKSNMPSLGDYRLDRNHD